MARRQRKSPEQLQQAILDAIQAAGGQIVHNDLIDQLEATGNQAAASMLLGLSSSGVIVPSVAIENNRGVTRYALPGFVPSAEGAAE